MRAGRERLAALLAFVAYRIARVRRHHVERSIRRANLPAGTARGMFRELATSLVELLWVALGWLTPADVVDIPQETVDAINAARARGPVMLWCAHTSNWELLAMRAATLFPLALIVKTQGVGLADRFIQRQRARFRLHTFRPAGAMKASRAAFQRGEVVATVIDQVPASSAHGDLTSFLGAPALTDRSPAVLAKRARAHVLVIFASREVRGPGAAAERVVASLALELSPEVVRRASARELMARATEALETHVRQHPSSWLWLHRRWKSPRPRTNPISAIAPIPLSSSTSPKTLLAPKKEVIEVTS